MLSFFFNHYRGKRLKCLGVSFIREWAQRVICLSHFAYYFIVRICWEDLKHLLSRFFIFSLPLNNQQDTVNYFPLDCAGWIIHLTIKNLEGSINRIVKFRWRFVSMRKKVDKYLFYLTIFGHGKPFNEIFHPNFSMVL